MGVSFNLAHDGCSPRRVSFNLVHEERSRSLPYREMADQMTTDGTPPSGTDKGGRYRAQPRTQSGKVAWRGARLVAPQRLVVDFVGTPPATPIALRAPRPTYEGVAEATDATVIVTVAMHLPELPPGSYRTGAGFRRTVVVELPEPLDGRGVVDGATGQLRPIVDAAMLQQPSSLPVGYRFGREWVDGDVDRREWWKESARDEVLAGPPGDPWGDGDGLEVRGLR